MKFVDLSGRVFGKLTVIARAVKTDRRTRWICRCACGKSITVIGDSLTTGNTKGCCGRGGNNRVHGLAGKNNPEYLIWVSMKQRCINPRNKDYANYGGRGVTVCPEWTESFLVFIAHVGPRPSDQHSIDRINNDGNYEPGNCRWATPKQQAGNKRPVKIVRGFDGRIQGAERCI